jgi:uncharacterized repeat protein (TIGR03806 family)
MKKIIVFVCLLGVVSIVYKLVSCRSVPSKVALDVAKAPFKNLSEYHFFTGMLKELIPNERVVPYDLNTPLFTDYAFKQRFVYVPEGKSAPFDTTEVLNLPVGSCLIKNFYYPEDFLQPEGKRRILETRLLVHRPSGWEALEYTWNEEQTEATLNNIGGIKQVSWKHYDGTTKTTDYVIPSKNQCKGCHWFNNAIRPIGPKIRNLNKEYAYVDGKENQLVRWQKMGFIDHVPPTDQCPKTPNWEDSVRYNIHQRARAYLDMNCGHCHNPKGPAYTSGFYLNLENESLSHLGFCKTPVAAGKATGGRLYDIVPGKPDESILVYRMKSEDPGVRMPELGKNMLHPEGISLIERWIASLNPDFCR